MIKKLILVLLSVLLAFSSCCYADEVDETVYKTLSLGDRDAEDELHVYYLQVQLNLYNYYTASPNGYFDEETRDALKEFQKANGLRVTGVADYETQSLLHSENSAIIVKSVPEQTFDAEGDSDTIKVQTLLIEWGFLTGTADGVIGSKTEQAIIDFKTYVHDNNMSDLYIDPDDSLPEEEEEIPLEAGEMPIVKDVKLSEAEEKDTYSPTSDISDELFTFMLSGSFTTYGKEVKTGDSGADVVRVQKRLVSLSYLYSGTDGSYGENTARAIKYFQLKNGLTETGVADELTQEKLFSADAVASEEYVFPYKLIVDVSDQRVYAYAWTGSGYDELYKTMKCSTGTRANPTLIGTFQAYGQCGGEWYHFNKYNCYAKWAYGIVGGYMFHSVIYSSANDSSLKRGTVSQLGHRASHGCVRLSVDDAYWLYHSCPYGTTVVVRE